MSESIPLLEIPKHFLQFVFAFSIISCLLQIPGFVPEFLLPQASADSLHYKMVIVINTSLKMGTGKIVSQAGHAILALYRLTLTMTGDVAQWVTMWEATG